MNRAKLSTVLFLSILIYGCGSRDSAKTPPKGAPTAPTGVMMAENRSHPLAKHIEIAGFRLSEKSQGKLTVQFAVINHSNADLTDLGMNVTLKPTTAAPSDPGFCTFSIKVPTLGPQEMKNATGECPTTMRIYELPDWQFIRAAYQITSPS